MPESVVEQLNKDKDRKVDMKEIQDALKSGFFDEQKNRTLLQKEFKGDKFDNLGSLRDTFKDSLTKAKDEITAKIKKNEPLSPPEIKMLKLNFMITDPNYGDVDFMNNDRKKDAKIAKFITQTNPDYGKNNSIVSKDYKKPQPNLSTKMTEKNASVDITQDISSLNQTLTETQSMMIDFLSNMKATMTSADTDYRLNNSIIDRMENFLQTHPLAACTSYADYQKQVQTMADFFNAMIHSNGKLTDKENPAYEYFFENSSAITGSDTVGADIFIAFGNMLNAMGTVKSVKDKEKIKGDYYSITREMLGGGFYGTKQGFAGSFYQSENMNKLQDDVLDAEDLQKYPDLKIVVDFLQTMKIKSTMDGQSPMSLQTEFAALIKNLTGKVPVKFIVYLENIAKESNLQDEMNVIVEKTDKVSISVISIMQVLGEQFQANNIKVTEQELTICCQQYLEKGEFPESIMTLFEMNGIDASKVKSLIQEKIINNGVKQYNMALYQRFSGLMLVSALKYDDGTGRADYLSKNNSLFKVYNDIEGVGKEGGMSDAKIQRLKGIADEIIITIAVTAFSGGMGSLAARGILGGIKAATIGGKIALFAAKMIVEGLVFHGVNTGITGLISGDRETMIEELKNPAARAKSVLYMGVMSGVGKVLNMGVLKMGSSSLGKMVNPKYLEALKKGLQIPIEITGMMATDQFISLAFSQQFQDITLESMIQTITLVIGLKIAHKIVPIVPPEGDITSDEVTITSMTKKEGVVTDVGYKQKIMNSLDAKVDYLAKQLKIKSSVRGSVAKNILNSIDISLAKEPGKDYSKPLQEVKNTIEQLRQEKKLQPDLENQYKKVVEKINKNMKSDLDKTIDLQEKPFEQLTFQEIKDIGIMEYIEKNELWKRPELSFDDVGKKQNFKDLTVVELERLVENIKSYKEKVTITSEPIVVDKNNINQQKIQSIINKNLDTGTGLYEIRDNNGNVPKNIPKEVNRQILTQSMKNAVDLVGNTGAVLKTGFSFLESKQYVADLDFAVKQKNAVDCLKKIQKNPKAIENLQITDRFNHQKILYDNIADVFDKTTGEIKPEIQELIDKNILRISFDTVVKVKIKGESCTGRMNTELFVEDGKQVFDVDMSKSTIVNVGGTQIRVLTPEGYMPYGFDLLVTDFAKEKSGKIEKNKILKRLNDCFRTLEIINRNEGKPIESKNIVTTLLDFVRNIFASGKIGKKGKIILIEGIQKEIEVNKQPGGNTEIAKGLEEVLFFTKEVLGAHEKLASGGKKLPSISGFMKKTEAVKKNIVEFKAKYDGKELDAAGKKQWKLIQKDIKELDSYDYSGENGFSHFFDYSCIKNLEAYKIDGFKYEKGGKPIISESVEKNTPIQPDVMLTDIENLFKEEYKKGLPKEDVIGDRNLGIYRYHDKIIKVVKDKRSVHPEQIMLMNERLNDLDNVFHPIHSFALEKGASCIVMNIAPGKDAGMLTPKEIESIPQEHWEKFEDTIRELSKRGVQTDLSKRSNFLYDKTKGFQFLDINGISMDGKGTDKFFQKEGKEYYYDFEKYRIFPKEYISAKDLFLSIKESEVKIKDLENKDDYSVYNEFIQYCEHPLFADWLLDPMLINSLPESLRTKEAFAKIISNSSKFQNSINSEIYGNEIAIVGSKNQYGKKRAEDSGKEILLQKIKDAGIDPNYVLVFRRTQNMNQSKPEIYRTTDFFETKNGLQKEISGESRDNSVIFVSSLAEIAKDSKIFRDRNDDQGLSIRRVDEKLFNTSRNLFSIL